MTVTTLLPEPATPLSHDSAARAFADILDGRADEPAIEVFLTELAIRGETAIEIAAAARALRERMIDLVAPDDAIDVCGTGGDGHHTLNVSTAVAIVVAACGVPVAKHGNRAASSKAGAADTLEALGLDLNAATAAAEATLSELGIAFLFAANHHPSLARLAPLRRRIGRRTIFNLMGPLANPARVGRQLVGIARPDYVPLYAESLELLGATAGAVVSGEDALDELSCAGPSIVANVGNAALPETISPEDAGLSRHPLTKIRGGEAPENADALKDLLAGGAGAYRDAVLLNAAAALMVAGRVDTLGDGAAQAAEAIDSARAAALLRRWIDRV
ncbi:anthranilate phosphoribosyltransferase [Sphingomonas sp. Y38-1Y]|uniref:anthranilate phosphoribosyltransferase n=1 Tax=Sphingomonas sp. Y38-1Y TaxID=3078265 RepID=UPI0028E8BE2E|nr:anthranilate phosphoribosyltransferase [Sphingomonas sp. Y38-1Y]